MTKAKKSSWAHDLLQEWLDAREWEDTPEYDEDGKEWFVRTRISLGGQSYQFFLQIAEETQLITLYLYPPYPLKSSKCGEFLELLNWLHRTITMGRFFVTDDGVIAYKNCMDIEGASPTALTIERMVFPALEWCAQYDGMLSAVAVTNRTTAQAYADYEKATEAAEKESEAPAEDDDVPDAL